MTGVETEEGFCTEDEMGNEGTLSSESEAYALETWVLERIKGPPWLLESSITESCFGNGGMQSLVSLGAEAAI